MPESLSQMQAQAPGDDPSQRKRKRRNSIAATEPVQKSRRLQALTSIPSLGHNTKQSSLLPSPLASQTPPEASRDSRKRNIALLLEDNPDSSQASYEPPQKRPQPSGSIVSDPVSYCLEGAASKSEPAPALPSLDPREQLQLARDGLARQFEEAVPRTSAPVIETLKEPAKELEAQEIEQKERHSPISYWAAYHAWPKDFADHNLMASSISVNKRPRTSDTSPSNKEERPSSYSQSHKNGKVREQYTTAYEMHIFTKGLDMDYLRGQQLASEESKKTCTQLLRIDVNTIGPTAVPQDKIGHIVHDCRNRNEAIVERDITPLMILSLRLLYYRGANDLGANNLEHVVDEVRAHWFKQCVLEEPQVRPDLAIGLFASAFTEGEIEKLKRYTSVDNWTYFTLQMFFPFLMCEVKCGREGLDIADRQNMHSCSVAVRAILRIEQEADKYRSGKQMDSLDRQVLVFSILRDQQDARLYGHYAKVQGEKWTYYRYRIRKFDLTTSDSLLAIHNFVKNILKSYLPKHLKRLQDALAALPDPNELPESSGLPSSTGLSFAASKISLNDDDFQQDPPRRDADGFVVPPRPAGSQNSRESQLVDLLNGQQTELTRLRQLLEEQREFRQLLEEQREEMKQEREKAEKEKSQLMQILEERKEAKQEREKAEQDRTELMNLLKQRISSS